MAVSCADVVSIEQSNEQFRLLFDNKGRFLIHRIAADEGKFKLCRIRRQEMNRRAVPVVVTHDARTIRYPDPEIKVHDTVKVIILMNLTVFCWNFVVFVLGFVISCHASRLILNQERLSISSSSRSEILL